MTIHMRFVPQDLWVGVYWKRVMAGVMDIKTGSERRWIATTIYVCIVPCLPIIFDFRKPTELTFMDFAAGRRKSVAT